MAVIRNAKSLATLADRAAIATGVLPRMIGLLNRAALQPGEALVLPRCNAIHTWFMRFPIDVLFLSCQPSAISDQPKTWVVVKAIPSVRPFRLAWAPGADTVVELPPGTIAQTGMRIGELLVIT
jgi:hypothetical protein